jgi:hypothetical protein
LEFFSDLPLLNLQLLDDLFVLFLALLLSLTAIVGAVVGTAVGGQDTSIVGDDVVGALQLFFALFPVFTIFDFEVGPGMKALGGQISESAVGEGVFDTLVDLLPLPESDFCSLRYRRR